MHPWLDDFAARSNSTPEQWDAIAALLPIADEELRRRCLLRCFRKIQWYWVMRDLDSQTAQSMSAETTRSALAEVARLARRLHADVHRLLAAIDALPFIAQIALDAKSPVKNWEEFIKNTAEEITRLAAKAEAEKAQVKDTPGQPAPDALDSLLCEIAMIWWRHIGKPFRRSEKRGGAYEFVRALVALADPDIGSGTLDHAMRRAARFWRNSTNKK